MSVSSETKSQALQKGDCLESGWEITETKAFTRSAGIISGTGVQQWTVPINLPYLTLLWHDSENELRLFTKQDELEGGKVFPKALAHLWDMEPFPSGSDLCSPRWLCRTIPTGDAQVEQLMQWMLRDLGIGQIHCKDESVPRWTTNHGGNWNRNGAKGLPVQQGHGEHIPNLQVVRKL